LDEVTTLGSSDKTTIDLRRSLIEAEHKVKLWKEQAEEARAESVHCKSNTKFLQIELESTQKELLRAQNECGQQGNLVLGLRAEIGELPFSLLSIRTELIGAENVDKLSREQAQLIGTIRKKYKNNSETLQAELQSTRQELTRIKDEHHQQAELLRELRAETGKPQRDSDTTFPC
jgi:chromosome segregation ATPase